MPNPSEFKLLRDEVARLMAENKGMGADIARLLQENSELRAAISERDARLAYYEGPHSPPSHGPVPSRRRRDANRTPARAPAGGGPRRAGGRPGHAGITNRPRADRTVHHRAPDRCAGCGGADWAPGERITCRFVTDLDSVPGAATTCHAVHSRTCGGCGRAGAPGGIPAIPGTAVGPNAAAVMTRPCAGTAGCTQTAGFLRDVFGYRISGAAVSSALAAIAGIPRGGHDDICGRVGGPPPSSPPSSPHSVCIDEAGMRVAGSAGCGWRGA